jgi:hypothetical protein
MSMEGERASPEEEGLFAYLFLATLVDDTK